ncbi:hypothetical protein H5410_049544 [Solanum commersonii]|uniref:Uncharacterized protein n=1 Tax=Solanum commersonii TaxID=4109 RepID=A0A9J5WUG9_SOLCO|nr:hypothetical protein H5410_049544 [Solanum commersonii]
MGKHMHFQVQTKLKRRKTQIYRFSCSIVHGFWVIRDPDFFWPKFFMDVRYNLIDGSMDFGDTSRRANGCIFNFKRSPMREKPNLIFFMCYSP